MTRRYIVPREVLKATQEHCIEAASRGVEGLVFWTGTADGEVRRCVIPRQSGTATLVTADATAIADMLLDCAARGEIVLAQVHSHLGAAFHSGTDNNGSVCHDIGFWSIVLADGGSGDVADGNGLLVFEHVGNQAWREVTGQELQDRLVILEDMYDRSAVFEKLTGARITSPKRILVSLSADVASRTNGQMMVVHALNLLPRLSQWCTTIDVLVPAETVCRLAVGYGSRLATVVLDLLQGIQPYGAYRILTAAEGEYDAALCIGHANLHGTPGVFIGSDGWVARAGRSPDIGETIGVENVLGAQGAAALGVAQLYARLGGIVVDDTIDPTTFSFFHMRPYEPGMSNPALPQSLHWDTMHIIGAGALTNATMQALRYLPALRGTFVVTDPEALDLTNNNRYTLMTYRNGVDKLSKVELIRRVWCNHPGVTIDSQATAFGSGHDLKADLVVTAVDRVAPRLEAQRRLPSILLNAGTNGAQFAISTHSRMGIVNNSERCVGCVIGVEDEPERRQREGTVSFVSSLAGICLASASVKELAFPREKSCLEVTLHAFGMNWPINNSGLAPRRECPLYQETHGKR
ncbi:MAG: hypothetical protein AB1700_05525 [Bacillota bacterium]